MCYQPALDLYQDLGERYYETVTLTHLGDTYQATDNPTPPAPPWQQSPAILNDLDAAQVRSRLRPATG